MNVALVPMEERHISVLAHIEKESFGELEAWSENLLRQELPQDNKHYFVAEVDGEIAGYGGYMQVLNEAHVMNIAVAKKFRRNGIGAMILERLLYDATGRNIISATLEVKTINKPAITLYEKYGFVSAGVRPHYYPDGHGAYIYWLNMEQ